MARRINDILWPADLCGPPQTCRDTQPFGIIDGTAALKREAGVIRFAERRLPNCSTICNQSSGDRFRRSRMVKLTRVGRDCLSLAGGGRKHPSPANLPCDPFERLAPLGGNTCRERLGLKFSKCNDAASQNTFGQFNAIGQRLACILFLRHE